MLRCQKHDARGRQIRRSQRRDAAMRSAEGAERKLELQEMTVRADAVRRYVLDAVCVVYTCRRLIDL